MAFQRRELLHVRARKTSDEKSACRERCCEKLKMEPPVRCSWTFLSASFRRLSSSAAHHLPSPAEPHSHVQTLQPGQGLGCVNKTVNVRRAVAGPHPAIPPGCRWTHVPIWPGGGLPPSWHSAERTRSSSPAAVYPKLISLFSGTSKGQVNSMTDKRWLGVSSSGLRSLETEVSSVS